MSSPAAGKGELLGHSTWHPEASAAEAPPRPNGLVPDGASTSLNNSPERTRRAAPKKSGFNMKGLLSSVSSHSFSRRTSLGGAKKTSSQVDTKGWFLEKQGKLDQAELMYSRHCVRAQKHHGKESLSLADNLDRLVHLLHKEGKLEEAEPLCRRALNIRRKTLGDDNEQVATAMVNLGRVLEEKGQYTDALIYLKKGLTIREKVLEDGHPDTVSALAWIGDICQKQDEYEEALEIAKKVLHAHEATLGPTKAYLRSFSRLPPGLKSLIGSMDNGVSLPSLFDELQDDIKVASSLNNVAGLLATTGVPEEALPLFARSHDIYVRHLGETHPHSVATQLWVQQLSAPAPPPRRARRPPAYPPRGDARSPPPPLIEERDGEEEDDDDATDHEPVSF